MNPFSHNAPTHGGNIMMELGYPELAEKFSLVIRFLQLYPLAASHAKKSKHSLGSTDYLVISAKKFADARKPSAPKPPSTIPDQMVSYILEHYFNRESSDLKRISDEHSLSMAAENIVGDLLERFIASKLEPIGWVWVSGSLIKAVDFLRAPGGTHENWLALQVKNRDNSENSSSAAIREGTEIKKWFRTFSKKAATNWEAFPDQGKIVFTEDGFMDFVKNYLIALKE